MPWERHAPRSIRRLYYSALHWLKRLKRQQKYYREMRFWRSQFEQDAGRIASAHLKRMMLAMAEQSDDSFLQNKIVADFGCGPLDSLWWADSARIRLGIDVLADAYSELDIATHQTCYVCSTEKRIPLPSNYVDVLYSVNALDHVTDFPAMCRELLRILAPGGQLIASINIEERPTVCEPQTLTESAVRRHLLQPLEVQSYRLAPKIRRGGCAFIEDVALPDDSASGPQYLWVRATKPVVASGGSQQRSPGGEASEAA